MYDLIKDWCYFLCVIKDDFEIDPTRYNRDTPSITQLKLELEQVEKSIKDLKLATITCDSMEIYPKY